MVLKSLLWTHAIPHMPGALCSTKTTQTLCSMVSLWGWGFFLSWDLNSVLTLLLHPYMTIAIMGILFYPRASRWNPGCCKLGRSPGSNSWSRPTQQGISPCSADSTGALSSSCWAAVAVPGLCSVQSECENGRSPASQKEDAESRGISWRTRRLIPGTWGGRFASYPPWWLLAKKNPTLLVKKTWSLLPHLGSRQLSKIILCPSTSIGLSDSQI